MHPSGRQPRPAARLRRKGGESRVPHLGRVRRSGRGRRAGAGRSRRARRRTRHPARRAERAGRRQHPGRHVPADRRAVSAEGVDRGRQPVGQLRLEFPEPRPRHGRRHQPRRLGRQRCSGRRRRLPRLLRRRPGHRSRSRVHRGHHRRQGVDGSPRGRSRAQAARRRQGRFDRRRGTGRRQSHRCPRRRRQGLRRCMSGGRADPGRQHRVGLRGCSLVRHPTAPGRAEHRGADHGRRLGRRDRGCDHPGSRSRVARPARRPAGCDRPEAPATLEPEQPDRLCRWRDPRHDPRGDGTRGHPPRRPLDHLPRASGSSRTRRR